MGSVFKQLSGLFPDFSARLCARLGAVRTHGKVGEVGYAASLFIQKNSN